MRKFFCTIIVIFIFSANGTSQTFQQGDNVINVGIGLGSALDAGNGKPNIGFNASYERGIWEAGPGLVSLGGYAGRVSFKDDGPGYEQKWNYTVIGVRGAWHYTELNHEKIDVYAGVMASYNIVDYSYESSGFSATSDSYSNSLGGSVFAGGRYYFTNNIAAFVEIGYGATFFNAGIAFKF
jgi:hypothetical protein